MKTGMDSGGRAREDWGRVGVLRVGQAGEAAVSRGIYESRE